MEPQLWVVVAAITLPFLAAAVVPFLHRLLGERVGYVGAVVALASFGLVASQLGRSGTVALAWIPSLGASLRFTVDGWALLFALLASGIGTLIFLYASSYMHGKPNLGRFYGTLLAFMGSILGVAFAADLIVLFVFWELTSVCSFVLIGYDTEDNEARYSARMAMIVTVGGGLCLLAGIALLSVGAGLALGNPTFDLATILANAEEIRTTLAASGLYLPVLALVGIAAAAKSAQVPLHFWLPNAMVAPTPVSAFLHSATMVKVGVYVFGRLRPLLIEIEWTIAVGTLGLLTMLVGAVLAVLATDSKELLAYSTASHLGLMVAGFGFSSHYGPEAGAFHLLNHALFKAALFLVAGIVAHEAGSRNIEKLGGLWRDLPITAGIAGIAALSMAGIPPLNGFYSKELVFKGAWAVAESGGGLLWLFPVIATVASVFTVLYSIRFLSMFFGDRPDLGEVPRPPALLTVSPLVLALLTALVSVQPDPVIDLIVQDAAQATAVAEVHVAAEIPLKLSGPVLMSVVAVVGGAGLYPVIDRLRRPLVAARSRARLLQPTEWYNWTLSGIEDASTRLDPVVHNGMIRTYVTWGLGTACALALGGYAAGAVGVPTAAFSAPVTIVIVLAIAVVAAGAVARTVTHVTGVLTLGILGFMIAIFYILASGPDLALTQLVVETLVLLIFLLVIEQMPAYYSDISLPVAVRDVSLSLLVGATAFISVLVAARGPEDGPTATARYYVDHAVEEGGGTNVVNVVLTDFRAFDTFGETIVIVTAAISVVVLLVMRTRGEIR